MDRARPEAVEVTQRILRVVELQVDPEVVVLKVKLAPVAVVAVLDPDDRLAEVGETEKQTFLDLLELAALDLVRLVRLVVLEAEHVVPPAEVRRQERVDERHVAVDPPDLEDLLPPEAELLVPPPALVVIVAILIIGAELSLVPPLLDVAEQLDAELVGVEPARRGGHRARVVVGVVDQLGGVERAGGHDRRVPVRGPPLVHDLRLPLRGEVVRLLPDDRQHVVLPGVQRGVLQEEQQDVALGGFGELLRLRFLGLLGLGLLPEDRGRVDVSVHVVLALEPGDARLVLLLGPEVVPVRLVPPLDERRVDVDQVLEREATVDEVLHGLFPVPLHVGTDPVAVVGHLVHHFAIGRAEPDVVLEEVVVAIDVRHDEFLIDPLIAAQQVGVAGVVVDDHLVDLLEPVAVALRELLVLHPEPPVRVPRREPAEGGDLGELVVVEDLEDRVVEVEPVGAGVRLGLDLELAQLGRQVVLGAHRRHGRIALPKLGSSGLGQELADLVLDHRHGTSHGFLSISISRTSDPSGLR